MFESLSLSSSFHVDVRDNIFLKRISLMHCYIDHDKIIFFSFDLHRQNFLSWISPI